MSIVKEYPFTGQVDSLWDGWLNNVKTMQRFQLDMQQKALEAFSYQQELQDYSKKTLESMEEESKKITEELFDKLEQSMAESKFASEPTIKWLKGLEEVSQSMQHLTWKPSYAMLDIYAGLQNQMEAAMKKTIDTLQKSNSESFEKIEQYVEQLKESQKEIVKPIME
jgi:hypothetical protein